MVQAVLTVPNDFSGSNAEQKAQAAIDTVDFTVLGLADLGIGVLNGCTVRQLGSPSTAVQSDAGQVVIGNAGYTVVANPNIPITSNSSGNPRFDLIVYRVGTGVIALPGTAAPAPFTAFPTPNFGTDVVLAAVYVASGFTQIVTTDIVWKGPAVQPAPLGAAPTLGAKLVVLGHSIAAGEGAVPYAHGCMSELAGMMRARLWNQAIPGAVLSEVQVPGTLGYGGAPQVAQSFLPPSQPTNWRGAYVPTTTVTLTTNCTWTTASYTVTTTGSFTTSVVTQGAMVIAAGIPPNTYVVSVNSATSLTISNLPTAAGTAATLTFNTPYYNADDGVTNSFTVATSTWSTGSTTVTTTASFATAPIVAGMLMPSAGPGIYVKTVNSTTSLTLNALPTTNGSGVTATFTGWYRCLQTAHAQTPTGVGSLFWILVAAGQPSYAAGVWSGVPALPIVMYGNNDIGVMYQKNPQPFLSAMQATLARLCAAFTWGNQNPMVTFGGATWATPTPFASVSAPFGFGQSSQAVPNTTGATITVNTPPDWPGGFVDYELLLSNGGNVLATGALNFTVDGSNVNCKCNGMADGPLVSVGSPNRQCIVGTSLTTRLASGVAVTTIACKNLPAAVANGNSIIVGTGGTTDTFTANGISAANATAITVTSHAPTNTHEVGDQIYDSSLPVGWLQTTNMVVRVPVPAGSHTVVATVQAGTTVTNLFFDSVILEASPLPTGVVIGLFKGINSPYATAPFDSDIDTWNTALTAMLGSGNEFPHIYVDFSNAIKQACTLTSAFTLGQAGITALPVTFVQNPIAAGDQVILGSGATQQTLNCSSPALVGDTSIAVTSFTSTYVQPIGATVFDLTTASRNIYADGLHPNNQGHSIVAALIWQAILNSLQTIPQLVAQQAMEAPNATAVQNLVGAGNNPTGVSGAWAFMAATTGVYAATQAEAGDIIEINVAGVWDSVASDAANLDIVTFNQPMLAALASNTNLTPILHYVSGVANFLNSTFGLGYAAVGAQAANGLVALGAQSSIATVTDKVVGKFFYPVQPSDIIDGWVYFAMIGKSATATARNILGTAGNTFNWSAKNIGPISATAVA